MKTAGIFFILLFSFTAKSFGFSSIALPDTIEFWYFKLNDSTLLNDNANTWADSSFKTIELKNYTDSDTLRFGMGGDNIHGLRNYIELRDKDNRLVWIEGNNCHFIPIKGSSGKEIWYKRIGEDEIKIPIISIIMSANIGREGSLIRVYFREGGKNTKYFLGYLKIEKFNQK